MEIFLQRRYFQPRMEFRMRKYIYIYIYTLLYNNHQGRGRGNEFVSKTISFFAKQLLSLRVFIAREMTGY